MSFHSCRKLGAALVALCVLVAAAPTSRPSEHDVKAAYLYNFLKFVEWPRDGVVPSTGPFLICVIGADPFGAVLDRTIASKEVLGRPVVIRRVGEPRNAIGCHVAFVGRVRNTTTTEVLRTLAGSRALTVGDEAGFTQRGGMVNFVLDGESVAFEINPAAAAREGLLLSPRLLQLSRIVAEDHVR